MWLANLLYSEQLAWPFDIFITTNYSSVVDHGAPARLYSFSIPLFSHMEAISHFLNSGVAYCGSATFPIPCPSYDTDAPYSAAPTGFSQYFSGAASLVQGQVSGGQGVTSHSWSSFSAGHWYVLCNSFSVSQDTGGMTPSQYIPHEAFNATRDFPSGVYKSPIDSVYPRAGLVKQFYSESAPTPTGWWGSTVSFSAKLNFNPELCWRESKTSLSVANFGYGTTAAGPPIRSLLPRYWLSVNLSTVLANVGITDTTAYEGTSTVYTALSASRGAHA